MKTTERIILYTALGALAAVNGVFLLSSTGRQAFAEASAWLGDLGPAEALKLVDGEREIAIRNKDGRVSWGDSEFRQTYAVGFVDISRALNPLMESAAFSDEREALRKELETVEADYKSKLDAYGEQFQGMDRETPQAQEKLEEARRLYQEYMDWGQEAMKKRNALDVRHLEQAYRELVNAVNVVADKMGIDIVLRFIPTDKEFKALDAEGALTDIRLRTAVKYPTKLDITREVLEEMSLPDEG